MSGYAASSEVLTTQSGNPIAVAPPLTAVSQQSTPWAANQSYPQGSQVTPGVVVGPTATQGMSKVYACLVPGLSGATAPAWNRFDGTLTMDNQVVWLNEGWFLG